CRSFDAAAALLNNRDYSRINASRTSPHPMSFSKFLLVTVLMSQSLAPAAFPAEPATARLTIDVTKPGPEISSMMHGVFFEDINYGADGGLYAELVQNRSFEHRDALFAWSSISRNATGQAVIASDDPLNAKNPHYLRIT